MTDRYVPTSGSLLVACPNLTVDRTVTIDELRPGEVLRFDEVAVTPGGKGVNVARTARDLGGSALLVCFAPGRTGRAAVELLGDEGLDVEAIPAGGEVRVTVVVIEPTGRVTVLNEPGPLLGADAWRGYERAVDERLRGHGVLVCSGSVPPGAPTDAYARLVRLARRHTVRVVVDAAGGQLAEALPESPDVVTPNLSEAEGIFGRATPDGVQPPAVEAQERALEAALALVRAGAGAAVVTAGEAGVGLADGEGTDWIPAPRVSVVRNPVGAGDAFAGGLACAIARGESFRDAVLAGVATAAASVETPIAGQVDAARAAELARLLGPKT